MKLIIIQWTNYDYYSKAIFEGMNEIAVTAISITIMTITSQQKFDECIKLKTEKFSCFTISDVILCGIITVEWNFPCNILVGTPGIAMMAQERQEGKTSLFIDITLEELQKVADRSEQVCASVSFVCFKIVWFQRCHYCPSNEQVMVKINSVGFRFSPYFVPCFNFYIFCLPSSDKKNDVVVQ